jgi:CrcB protein
VSHYIVVALGGGIGACLRFALAGFIHQTAPSLSFPLPTFVVNLLGCFCAGLLLAVSDRLGGIGNSWHHLLMTGLLGGFTTFSTFGVETIDLMKRGMIGYAATYAVGSVAAGVLALYLATILAGRS